jgi:hypothetical protein
MALFQNKFELFLFGFATGILASVFVPFNNELKIFQREQNKPSVARTYNFGIDEIHVEDPNVGKYIPLGDYLDKIPDKADRELERAEIKKVVGWYD